MGIYTPTTDMPIADRATCIVFDPHARGSGRRMTLILTSFPCNGYSLGSYIVFINYYCGLCGYSFDQTMGLA